MEIIREQAFARAALVGNPSDGYGGKTIAVLVRDFAARVVLYEWDHVEVLAPADEHGGFGSVRELTADIRLHGYYGGVRLVKAAIKCFTEHCDALGIPLHDRNFAVRYESNIPRQVGLAGSSAIVVASLRALCRFFAVTLPPDELASLALHVESHELGIPAGLQDRVIQSLEGLVFMDFADSASRLVHGLKAGSYQSLPIETLPPLYLAYRRDASEPTEVFHDNLRRRYLDKEPAVIAAMSTLAGLVEDARRALVGGDHQALACAIDRNFDVRRSICALPRPHVEMVDRARAVGVSANFAGSGGAIVGTYRDAAQLATLRERLASVGCDVIVPQLS